MFQKNKTVFTSDLGVRDYKTVWDYQELLQQEIVAQKIENRNLREHNQVATKNHLLLVEHPHVYTLGKSGKESHLLISDDFLKQIQATYYKINRGGDITYHGPGQLVVYPVLDLENFFTDIHKYLRLLEEVIIRVLATYGLEGSRSEGETGVWLDTNSPDARKICAMGVHCSRWVTKHGLALNVNTNMDYFQYIVPCGIADKAVTSLEKEIGRKVDMEDVKEKFCHYFEQIFVCHLVKKANNLAAISR